MGGIGEVMSNKDINAMSLAEIVDELDMLNDAECNCETSSPWRRCAVCVAGGAVNNAAEVLRNGLLEARQLAENASAHNDQ